MAKEFMVPRRNAGSPARRSASGGLAGSGSQGESPIMKCAPTSSRPRSSIVFVHTLEGRTPLFFIISTMMLLTLFVVSFSGCTKQAEPEARVLFIGLDGIEMDVLKPLLEKGDLPNMAALMERGVYGYLDTLKPAFSPVVWTSIATGKHPDDHRINGFLDNATGTPFTSNSRKGRALWNIVGEYGLRCNVTGYWITYPAEPISGNMVSQVSSQAQYSEIWKGMLYEDVKDATYPPELIETVWPVVESFQTPEFIENTVIPEIFGDMAKLDPSDEVKKLVADSNWSFAGDYVYLEAAKYLLDHDPADLDIVYLGGTDVVAHRFWRYRDPERYTYHIMDKYLDQFGEAIDNYYRLADRMVGELVAKVPENTRIILLSDHGMHADFPDGRDKGKRTLLSAHHMDGPPGVLIAAGEGIRKGPGLKPLLAGEKVPYLGTIFDVARTVLYLLDVPTARDAKAAQLMKTVVDEGLLAARPEERVDTHDEDFRPPSAPRSSMDANEAFIARFAELGYLEEKPKGYQMGKRRGTK